MIASFASKDTEKLFHRHFVKRFSGIAEQALDQLLVLSSAESLEDLRRLPGNRLEALKGDRKGQYSIRVNDQYPVCFRWRQRQGAFDVEIVDYH